MVQRQLIIFGVTFLGPSVIAASADVACAALPNPSAKAMAPSLLQRNQALIAKQLDEVQGEAQVDQPAMRALTSELPNRRRRCERRPDGEELLTPYGGAQLRQYPGYVGPLKVAGFVAVSHYGNGALALQWRMKGLEEAGYCKESALTAAESPEVSGGAEVDTGPANACGVHIHAGMTCDLEDKVGGHFYDAKPFDTVRKADPWVEATRYVAVDGFSTGFSLAEVGESFANFSAVEHRAVVVHDANGTRAACGLIVGGKPRGRATLTKYPGYAGDVKICGTVTVNQLLDAGTVSIQYQLFSKEARLCTNPPNATDACGIEIMMSKTGCNDTASIGVRYFDQESFAGDPWQSAIWGKTDADPWVDTVYRKQPFAAGRASLGWATGARSLKVGKTPLANFEGQVVAVAHDHTGARVACGVVE